MFVCGIEVNVNLHQSGLSLFLCLSLSWKKIKLTSIRVVLSQEVREVKLASRLVDRPLQDLLDPLQLLLGQDHPLAPTQRLLKLNACQDCFEICNVKLAVLDGILLLSVLNTCLIVEVVGEYITVRIIFSRHNGVLIGKPLDFDVLRPQEDILHGFADVEAPFSVPHGHVFIPGVHIIEI